MKKYNVFLHELALAEMPPGSEPETLGDLKFFDSLEEAQAFAEANKDNYTHIEISPSNESDKIITSYINGEKQD